jgi:hypothetical protein
MPFGIICLMGTTHRKKGAKTSPVFTEAENDGLRLLAKMIVRSLLRQNDENYRKPGGEKKIEIPSESISRENHTIDDKARE